MKIVYNHSKVIKQPKQALLILEDKITKSFFE